MFVLSCFSLCGNAEGEEWGLTLMKLDGGRSTSNKQSAFFTLSPESTLCFNRIVISNVTKKKCFDLYSYWTEISSNKNPERK